MCGDSGVNLVYTCPDWCEEFPGSGLRDVTDDIITRTFHQNCVVPTILSKLFYPTLQAASKANTEKPLNRRRAAIVHLIGKSGTLTPSHFPDTPATMLAYSASLSAMIMSMKTMSYEFSKRGDGILVVGVIVDSSHHQGDYSVERVRDGVSRVVHGAGPEQHGKCVWYDDGRDTASQLNSPSLRRRAGIVHLISKSGTLTPSHFPDTPATMLAYSASLSAMIMSLKTMSYEFSKRGDGILVVGVIVDSSHHQGDYSVERVRDGVSRVVHGAGPEQHGKCVWYDDGRDVSY
eukprot:sb/3467636/